MVQGGEREEREGEAVGGNERIAKGSGWASVCIVKFFLE